MFAHVLGDLTIAVHPEEQGRGVGRTLHESLGFVVEGRLRGRVRGVSGAFEDDLVMGWLR